MKLRHIVHLRRLSKHSLQIVAWTFSIFIGIILAFSAWLYFQEAKVKEILIRELNKRLVTEIQVSDVQFSILKSFPYTSIDFINPQSQGAHSSDPEYLFKAKRISLHFNIMDIYYGKYDIKRIEVQDGTFNLKCYQGNDYNFHIWKNDNEGNPNFRFSLNKIIGKNVKIRYRDMAANYDYAIETSQLSAKGNFDQSEQSIWIKTKYENCLLKFHDFVFLKEKEGELNLSLKNNIDKKYCEISEGRLGINGLLFSVMGNIQYDKRNMLDVQIQGIKLSINDFISTLPDTERSYFTDYSSKGILDFDLRIKGNFHIANGLNIQSIFHCKDAEIIHKPSKTNISNINIQGNYTNGAEHSFASSSLHLKNFSGHLPSGKFSAQLRLQNFSQPTLTCETTIEADLEELNKFLGLKKEFLCSGNLNLSLSYQNTFSSLDFRKIQKEDFLYSQCHGSARITNFNFYTEKPVSYSVQSPDLSFDFTPENVNLKYTTLKINRQEMSLSANFTNIFSAIFLENQKLSVRADIKAKRIDAALIFPFISQQNTNKTITKKQGDSGISALGLPFLLDNLSLNCDISIDHFILEGIDYQNLQTFISANAKIYKLTPFSVNLFDGSTKGSIDIRNLSPDRFLINMDVVNTNLNIQKLLQAFNNFGQSQLTSEQISGILNNEMQFSAIYDFKLGINLNSILLWSKLNLSKGQLRNAEIMKLLAKYTGEKDLHLIHFADINNIIEIKEAVIYIPEMFIFSNALNLKISGEHHFNNNVNYLIKIELSELLSRRRKARNTKNKDEEFGLVEPGNRSIMVLPIRITGNLSNPHIEYDARTTKQQIIEAQHKEKENVRQILKEELSGLKNAENQADKKVWKEQENGKFKINWEEENPKPITPEPKSTNTKDTKKESAKFKIEFDAE